MKDVVHGEMIPFGELEKVTDWAAVKKVRIDIIFCLTRSHISL